MKKALLTQKKDKFVITANEHQKQLNDIKIELNIQRKDLEELKSLTGADVKKTLRKLPKKLVYIRNCS